MVIFFSIGVLHSWKGQNLKQYTFCSTIIRDSKPIIVFELIWIVFAVKQQGNHSGDTKNAYVTTIKKQSMKLVHIHSDVRHALIMHN